MGELQRLAEAAAEREDNCDCGQSGCDKCDSGEAIYGGLTRNQICDKAEASMDAINEICDHPMAHKLIVLQILHNLFEWHSRSGQRLAADGDVEQATGWLQDAGKFQSLCNILTNVSVDPADFTTTWFEDDN